MKEKNIKIGMKVVPHYKSGYSSWDWWKRSDRKHAKFFRENGYLFVSTVDLYSKEYCLSSEIDSLGDIFLASDFEPYQEKQENKQEEYPKIPFTVIMPL